MPDNLTMLEKKSIISNSIIYKISLGGEAVFRKEALENRVLVLGTNPDLHAMICLGDKDEIYRVGQRIKVTDYPKGGAPLNAIDVWWRNTEAFINLPRHSVVLHMDSENGCLYWSIAGETIYKAREEQGGYWIKGDVFYRSLDAGWHKTTLGGVPLTNIHPKARDLAINQATLSKIVTDTDYFRSLLIDNDCSFWESSKEWKEKSGASNWRPKNKLYFIEQQRVVIITKQICDIIEYFEEEIRRMARTALATAAYSKGQPVTRFVKQKNIEYNREELEIEIKDLLIRQDYLCALTGYKFRLDEKNVHLRPSLDRKDSNLGYIAGNIQVVTRAANFFKSDSDEKDWKLKEVAITKMAISIQKRSITSSS